MAKRRTEEEWMLLVKDFKNSKLNLTEWCRKCGISKSSIYPYIKKYNKQNCLMEPEWAVITMPNVTETSSISLRVGTITLDIKNGFNKELLSDVLSVVISLC